MKESLSLLRNYNKASCIVGFGLSFATSTPLRAVRRPLKTARYGGISQIWLGLRVRKVAVGGPGRAPVSQALFLGLLFGGGAGPQPAATTPREGPPARGHGPPPDPRER